MTKNLEKLRNEELMSLMSNYALTYNVHEMLQIVMERILKEQPEYPLDFISEVIQNDPNIIALEKRSRDASLDTRSDSEKKELLTTIYKTISHAPITKTEFLQMLASPDIVSALKKSFPKHYLCLSRWFQINENEVPEKISMQYVIDKSLKLLQGKYMRGLNITKTASP